VQRQCDLLGVPRSSYYYQPRPESAENLRLLRRLDELYMECPFFGSRRMAVTLEVGRKRMQRLMRILGVEALYPKPNLSRPAPGHQIYPYLLRGVSIERPNQVWSTDITYLPMHGGFLFRRLPGTQVDRKLRRVTPQALQTDDLCQPLFYP
jgi:putative transposase